MITAKQLRKKYLDFFKEKGHAIIPSASLIPENDPTVLFTTAGMHPLVPYLMGEKHPEGKRLASVQKCIRTGDIEEVGDATHLTFFEMLGNWSLGDYFKKEAIEWSFEFLTDEKWLGIPVEKLAISVFEGDDSAPRDEESAKIWKSFGIPEKRIAYLGKEDNWWGPAGKTGPCGPDTEMFYWSGEGRAPEEFNPEDDNWVEIWNDVFMEYDKQADGTCKPLKQKNVDTGLGLERTVAVLSNEKSPYETELFLPIMHKIEELSGKNYTDDEETRKSMRIIADHLRAAVFILGDPRGVSPSNLEQGYVLRRLIRRSIVHAKKLGVDKPFIHKVGEIVVNEYGDVYPELEQNKDRVIEELKQEEERFGKTLERGMRRFEKAVRACGSRITGQAAFELFATHGFPLEVTQEMAKERGISVDVKGYKEEFKKHQDISRAGAEQKFSGGLADESEEVKKLHTATHLLHRALKNVLSEDIEQKGSNITAERLRFDFNYPEKVPADKLKEVEDMVNEQIKKDLPVYCEEMTAEEAKKTGAAGYFDEKYKNLSKVKVYFIGNDKTGRFSSEICGGPHAKSTGELGEFKIKKEKAVSAGVRRIKATVSVNQK